MMVGQIGIAIEFHLLSVLAVIVFVVAAVEHYGMQFHLVF